MIPAVRRASISARLAPALRIARSRLRESRLFGGDDGVASVARAELEQDVCDVALDGFGVEGEGSAQFVGC
jgi:hypothetical protein